MRAKSGFTLVEFLIIGVILGILAAIVVPQFSQASIEARESSLCGDLQTMRSKIDLYKVQHGDCLPGMGSASVQEALTGLTDVDGNVAEEVGDGVYVPYVKEIPTNPFNELNTIRQDGVAAGANTHGWRLDMSSGVFQADDDKSCGDGKAHTDL